MLLLPPVSRPLSFDLLDRASANATKKLYNFLRRHEAPRIGNKTLVRRCRGRRTRERTIVSGVVKRIASVNFTTPLKPWIVPGNGTFFRRGLVSSKARGRSKTIYQSLSNQRLPSEQGCIRGLSRDRPCRWLSPGTLTSGSLLVTWPTAKP